MERIIDELFVGSDKDDDYASTRGWSILRCCKDGPHSHRSMLGYSGRSAPEGKNYYYVQDGNKMALNLIDSDDPNYIPEQAINAGLQFAKQQLEDGNNLLIHCNSGHSRGPTTCLMLLRLIGEMPSNFRQSVKKFQTLYPPYSPAHGIFQFARSNWNNLSMLGKVENV